ncbi:hypothetical protein PUR_02890 [Paenibacillus sp. URB8-2]|nr:hypothetical protein PUR_02890 [Paenibacillus sp. URB8-2]
MNRMERFGGGVLHFSGDISGPLRGVRLRRETANRGENRLQGDMEDLINMECVSYFGFSKLVLDFNT